MEKIPPFSELILVFKRHFVKFASIIVLGVIGSIIYALNQPRAYETAAMVQILQPAVPATGTQSTTSGATLQRLQIVEQRLMARDNLLKVIEKFDLYPGLSLSDKVLHLRVSTRIEKIQDLALRWRSDVSPTALIIRVTDGDPETAAKIANEFVELLLAQSRERNAEKAQEALGFFESEAARVGKEIAELDKVIAKFKEENAPVMPEGLSSMRAELVILNASVLEIESKIVTLKSESANVQNAAAKSKLQRWNKQVSLLDSKREQINSQLARGPEVEREFVSLTRRLRSLTDQYNIINTSRAEAEMGQMLEASRYSTDFKTLETALVPQHPISPNRKKITIMGIAFSIVIAIGLIAVLELWKPVIRNSSQLSRRLDIQPVIAIPTLQAPRYSILERIIQFLKSRKTKKA